MPLLSWLMLTVLVWFPFHHVHTENAIQAFGYGSEAGHIPMLESQPSLPSLPPVRTNLQPAIITKPSISSNDIKPIDNACIYSTCANLKVGKAAGFSLVILCS